MRARRARQAERARSARQAGEGLAGLDLARWRGSSTGSGLPVALLAGVLLGALLLVALRMDIVRMRYAKTEALERGEALRREHAELVVQVQRLRDPSRLARLGGEHGFAPPDRVVELRPRPSVAAGPPAGTAAGGAP